MEVGKAMEMMNEDNFIAVDYLEYAAKCIVEDKREGKLTGKVSGVPRRDGDCKWECLYSDYGPLV